MSRIEQYMISRQCKNAEALEQMRHIRKRETL